MTGIPAAPDRSIPGTTERVPRLGKNERLLRLVASVDHKEIGLMYIVVTFVFFVIGGIESLLMRIQLGAPNNTFLSPSAYNQIFTMHGTTMIFLVVMPLLIGIATYFVPLMIGATDMAFPRLNALSFWLLLFGGLLLYYSFVAGGAPAAGWFSYPPLSERPFSSTTGQDYWGLGLLATGIGSVLSGLNFIVTVATLRAPGMTIRRLPLFVWMNLINGFLILGALPALNATIVMQLADRLFNARFFNALNGGSPILYQHTFWSFGHPEVYIMVLPAFGMISEIIPVFSRKPIFGYSFVAASTLAIGFLSFSVWAHHMFAVGLGPVWESIFGASSSLIAIPTGIKVLNWVATMWGGRIRFTTAMLFATSFLVMFTIGGLTGVTFAIVPIDWQTTDTYYVVAHFHYVLFGGTLLAIFAGLYYWFPKVTGRLLNEYWGKWHFWLTLIGFNLTFFIQHILGLMGMPRRVYTYPDIAWWGLFNLISTIGSLVLAVSVLVLVWNVFISLRRGEVAGDNPWNAWTLEWATTSPPPHHNFDMVPPVNGRRPLWDLAHPDQADEQLRPDSIPAPNVPPSSINANRFGMGLFLFSEVVFFAILILAYIYYGGGAQDGPSAATALNPIKTGIYTVALLASSFTFWLGGRSWKAGQLGRGRAWLLATVVLGAIFLIGQGLEYANLISQHITLSRNLFGSTFFTLTGFHGLHVLGGITAIAILSILAFTNRGKALEHNAIQTVELYWHFVDVVWIVIFGLIYVLPHL